eukprot:CAMPEP_0171693544 /NCGR_PEP_ID=MMETSP0991-20121206/6710_1 /TAXON_ID=483369 /ORGANISM="non described non described, Strain CCMP2098" /LENGTH=173 /DNA_ID=CAMNT_0012282009 /DNA_START=675 /DNA_END=1197 /DNA_ORIENTATION=-
MSPKPSMVKPPEKSWIRGRSRSMGSSSVRQPAAEGYFSHRLGSAVGWLPVATLTIERGQKHEEHVVHKREAEQGGGDSQVGQPDHPEKERAQAAPKQVLQQKRPRPREASQEPGEREQGPEPVAGGVQRRDGATQLRVGQHALGLGGPEQLPDSRAKEHASHRRGRASKYKST